MTNDNISNLVPLSQEQLQEIRKYCITDAFLFFDKKVYLNKHSSHDSKRWMIEVGPNRKRVVLARYMYEQKNGIVGKEFVITHKCGNSECLNIDHLDKNTQHYNMREAVCHGSFKKKLNGLDDYKKICHEYAINKRTQKDIANEFKVNQGTIRDILDRYLKEFTGIDFITRSQSCLLPA